MSLIHSTSMYRALLRLQVLCLSASTIVNETDVQGLPCVVGTVHWWMKKSKYLVPRKKGKNWMLRLKIMLLLGGRAEEGLLEM